VSYSKGTFDCCQQTLTGVASHYDSCHGRLKTKLLQLNPPNKTFHYLKVEFYTKTGKEFKKVMLPHTVNLKNAGLRKSGSFGQ